MGASLDTEAATDGTKEELLRDSQSRGGQILSIATRQQLESAVCLIGIRSNERTGTGILMNICDRTCVLTNHHIVSSKKMCCDMELTFGYLSDSEQGVSYSIDSECFFVTNAALDYTLFSFEEETFDRDKYSPILLEAPEMEAVVDSSVWTVQHPGGRFKAISHQVIASVDGPFIQYKADTEPGSSGAAVFLNSELIAIHHTGYRIKQVNEGTLISAVAEDVLKQLRGDYTKFVDKWLGSRDEVRILMFGKTGQGKSSLVNALIGKSADEADAAAENEGEAETKSVNEYSVNIDGVDVRVFDSPGLFDGNYRDKEYLSRMGVENDNYDIILFCTNFTDTRFTDDAHKRMLRQLVGLGEKALEKSIFVFTFANTYQPPGWKKMRSEKKKLKFQNRLEFVISKCQTELNLAARQDGIEISNIIGEPSGYQDDYKLPDRPNWLSELWTTIAEKMEPQGLPAFLRATLKADGGVATMLSSKQLKRVEAATRRAQQAFTDMMDAAWRFYFHALGGFTPASVTEKLNDERIERYRDVCLQNRCRQGHELQSIRQGLVMSVLSPAICQICCGASYMKTYGVGCEQCWLFLCKKCVTKLKKITNKIT